MTFGCFSSSCVFWEMCLPQHEMKKSNTIAFHIKMFSEMSNRQTAKGKKLDSWQMRPAVIQTYGKHAKPKIAGLKTHTADDWEGKSCKWVFVPELGSDMMHAEMTDRNRLQDGRLLVDGESERAEALADETMEEFSQAMVNLNPTSDRGVVKRKDGGEVKLPAFTMEVRYQHQIKCNIFNE